MLRVAASRKVVVTVFLSLLIIFLLLQTKLITSNSENIPTQSKLHTEPSKPTTTEGSTIPHHQTFKNDIKTFPWKAWLQNKASSSTDDEEHLAERLLTLLVKYLIVEPFEPVDQTCGAPRLPPSNTIQCTEYPKAFNGTRRDKPAKVAHLIQLGFDVDVLEIHLHELYDVVDYFFIIESPHSHLHHRRKPLIWERIRFQPRFSKFQDKVIQLIVDDSEFAQLDDDMWGLEFLQEKLRWKKFLQWNQATQYFHDDDVIGFGDADEIASRNNVHLMKHCFFAGPSIDIGSWFSYGKTYRAFSADWPVPDHSFTLGDPSFFTLKSAINFGKPSRMRGKSGYYLLGGIHMTHYGYLPFQLCKRFTCSECGDQDIVSDYFDYLVNGQVEELEYELSKVPKSLQSRIVPLEVIPPEVAFLPWFFQCNRKRYHVFETEHYHDLRLDQ